MFYKLGKYAIYFLVIFYCKYVYCPYDALKTM